MKFPKIAIAVVAILLSMSIAACDNDEVSNEQTLDVSDHVLYIESIFSSPQKTGDPDRIYAAIDKITVTLDNPATTDNDRVRLRYWRAVAYSQLNEMRRFNGDAPNTSEAKAALADLEYVISVSATLSVQSAQFLAGVIALNDLKDAKRAGTYWLPCADAGHAGCMNTVADGYFGGQFGLEKDLVKSFEYHLKVYETGTRFTCAGLFSGFAISKMTLLQPEQDHLRTWQEWLEEVFNLESELSETRNITYLCAPSIIRLEMYLMYLLSGNEKPEILNEVREYYTDPSYTLASYFLGEIDRETAYAAINTKDDYSKCASLVQLIWYSIATGNSENIEKDKLELQIADDRMCASAKTWVSLLENYEQ